MTTAFQGPEWATDDSRRELAEEQLTRCEDFIEVNRIFFSGKFCKELSENIDQCRQVISDMQRAQSREKSQNFDVQPGNPIRLKKGERPLDLWIEQERKVKTEIKDRRIELAKSFREIMGVKEEKP